MASTAAELIARVRESRDWRERRLAIVGLGHQRNEEIFPVLLASLDDPVISVRHAAVVALGRYGDRRAVRELLRPKILAEPDPHLRWAAVSALGKLGDHQVIDRLVDLVDDEEWLVHNEAVMVLREKVAEIIRAHDPSLGRVLIRLLNIPDGTIVEMAKGGLLGLGVAASPMLCEALESVREPIRRHSAEVMGRLGDPKGLPSLIAVMEDEVPGVRCAAATAIGRIGDRAGLASLIAALGDYDEAVRDAIVEALVRFGGDATPLICSALEHAHSKLARGTAIEALGRIGDERAIPILLEHLSSSYHLVRSAAITALQQFGEGPVGPLIRMLSFNKSDISLLLKEVEESTDTQTRIRAVNALGVLEDHRAVEVLKSLLSNPVRRLSTAAQEALGRIGCAAWGRSGAARVLGQSGDRSAIPGILSLLDDDSVTVRRAAVASLIGVGNELDAGRLLVVAREDPDPLVRDASLITLRELVPGTAELFDAAMEVLDDEAADVRVRATRIVGEFLDGRAIEPLLALLSDPSWSVRIAAESALCSQGRQIVPHLIEILRTGSLIARRRAYSALGRIGDPSAAEAVEHLVGREEDPVSIQLARTALRVLWGGEEPT